ncbi:protein-glutamate O-methyltransferase CheR [Aliiglaciecola sp. LCG003]|uniref:CheR family methyltransferase n=1 Tax=Aliiglaciecola sp. LCG003 TaxID=3053655 RepID=UPI002572736B|nr:protein-glutamate O-methyltransferase CheR [Aliiglaciecola sp. LCG003]WJG10548.1 protein-glutamate O-methyltransferase CheR [Aliiglaciecola sp. LCG003]
MNTNELSHQDFVQFAQFLERQCGIVLSESKAYLVKSRLMPLVRQENQQDLSAMLKAVVTGRNSLLREKVIDAMTTNETLWFRDKYPFEILSKDLFQNLTSLNRKVRIWSAACSSGQEPYSIAMLVQEYKRQNPRAFPAGVEIVATDISADMLQKARLAQYDGLSLGRGLPDDLKQRYFTSLDNGSMQLARGVSSLVNFQELNLLGSFANLGRFDIVFCRNVLIYFSQQNKRKILQQIAASLQDNGILFLGASESISEVTDQFSMIRNNPGLYYQKKP